MEFRESEVVGACALRFAGYSYIDETGFDVAKALTCFFESGRWDITPTDQLATFFMLQRSFRWSLEYEPRNGMYWRAFRELFLLLAGRDVPKAYRLHPCYEEWQEKYAPHLVEHLRRVGFIHWNTRYVIATMLRTREVFPPPRR